MHTILPHIIGTFFNIINEWRCHNVKTKSRPGKIVCHSTYHIKNVNKPLQFFYLCWTEKLYNMASTRNVLSVSLLSVAFFLNFSNVRMYPTIFQCLEKLILTRRYSCRSRALYRWPSRRRVTHLRRPSRRVTGCRPRWRREIVVRRPYRSRCAFSACVLGAACSSIGRPRRGGCVSQAPLQHAAAWEVARAPVRVTTAKEPV